MLRIITKAKMEHLVSRYNQSIKEVSSAKAEANKLALQLEICQEQLGKTEAELEDTKDKYKKYMKQAQKSQSQAAKKWLNGYPDE
jgi:F0F1-type ATP synthase membrane subunit b/b'